MYDDEDTTTAATVEPDTTAGDTDAAEQPDAAEDTDAADVA